MKNAFTKSMGLAALAVMLLTLFGQMAVSAQDRVMELVPELRNNDASAAQSEPRDEYRKIEGSWNNVTTRRNCVTGAATGTFPSMFTFSQGGTMWEAGAGADPKLRGASHGVWRLESNGVYVTAVQFFRFNADGTPAGRQIIRQVIELSPDWTTYTATAAVQVLDVNGNVIANNCATGVGTRFD
ncbi:MAG TPA: hypothetical protein VEV84_07880 [Pyrinomonadaceae bacterium]|nr:hypothetical protein [Pyrinomonadaceae bacterium]